MKYQFLINSMEHESEFDTIYSYCVSKKLEHVACTSMLLGNVVEEVPRDKIIAILDYPFGNSSFVARQADLEYCIDMGVKTVEITINVEMLLNRSMSKYLCEEFNVLYELAADKKCILNPIIDYRLAQDFSSAGNGNEISRIINFMKDEISINALTINTGQICDSTSDNLKVCKRFASKKFSITTCRELYSPDDIDSITPYVYRLRLSNPRSLRLIP